MKHQTHQTKHILYATLCSVSIPTLLLLIILTAYTIQRQVISNRTDIQLHLEQISNNMEKVLKHSEQQLTNITAQGSVFQQLHYSDTQLDKYSAAYDTMQLLRPVLTQDPSLGAFFLYSQNQQSAYYYPTYQFNYPYSDQQALKEFLTKPKHPASERNRWIPFALSDRTVLLYMAGFDNTICAVMVDPSLDDTISASPNTSTGARLFYASLSGKPYTSDLRMHDYLFPYINKSFQKLNYQNTKYQLICTTVGNYDMQLCHLMSYQSVFSHLNLFQTLLLTGIILLILSISLVWFYLYKKLISPLRTLMETMSAVSEGNLNLRVSTSYSIQELQDLSQTFNHMLDSIHRLKLDSYEKKIDLQQARLQYLQLQIRPHFYLNCLKGLFSMAEKRQYHEIQESVLALSEYFRYIFRNNQEFVSLTEEIHSVSSYLKLQQLYFSCCPELSMNISAEAADVPVPPLSILTFVENSIKHRSDQRQIRIQIKASLILIDSVSYLNLTVSDNCGGFPKNMLEILNHLDQHDFLYKDYHVGIYNIYYRLKLTYNNKSTLAFYNIGNQGCVDLIIPLEKG